MREIKEIILHCSDSEQGRGDSAETIHEWHLQRGWNGIGYHYVIDEDGKIEGGRPEYWIGAHVKGHNSESIGICLIGKGEYTDAQIISSLRLLKELTVAFPKAIIYEHNYFNKSKTCPMLNISILKTIKHFFKDKFLTDNLEVMRVD